MNSIDSLALNLGRAYDYVSHSKISNCLLSTKQKVSKFIETNPGLLFSAASLGVAVALATPGSNVVMMSAVAGGVILGAAFGIVNQLFLNKKIDHATHDKINFLFGTINLAATIISPSYGLTVALSNLGTSAVIWADRLYHKY